MYEVFFTQTGATIALFTNEIFAKQYVNSMLADGHSVDYEPASFQTASLVIRDMF